MASITDVAKKAGVGIATASRVINGTGYVSEETRQKVQAVIEEMNYVPNELARNLQQNKTNTVAVILPDVSDLFFAALLKEIEYLLRKKGYKTMLCCSDGEETNEEAFLDMLKRNLVDGVITTSNLLKQGSYAEIKRPMVSIDSILSEDIPMVCSNHKKGGKEAAQMLLDAGCRHIFQVRDTVNEEIKDRDKEHEISTKLFPFVERHIAFEKTVRSAMKKAKKKSKISYHETLSLGLTSADAYRSQAKEMFNKYPDIDGIMATDFAAIQYGIEAHSRGIKIPEDLKIVAYDGTDAVRMFYPEISCIRQQIDKIAGEAVKLLLLQIDQKTVKKNRITLPVQVINKYESETRANK